MSSRKAIISQLKEVLSQDRFEHSLRVEKTALALARKYRVNLKKASLAALLHDYARQYGRPELVKQAKRHGLPVDPISQFEPKLLHAELSAILAKRDFGIKAADILRAIARHTLGAPKMSKLEKVVYLADHIEEGRDFAGVDKIRKLAFTDMDRAILESTATMLQHLLAERLPIHPETIRTRNYYLLKV